MPEIAAAGDPAVAARAEAGSTRLDIAGLVIAGVVNTILAPAVVAILLAPGMLTAGGGADVRAAWIAAHPEAWRVGWAFWFAVTLTFAWSYLALGRHLDRPGLVRLASASAVAAAAVDMVGITIALVALPIAAQAATGPVGVSAFAVVEVTAFALVSGVAFGIYTLAGLLLVGAAAGTAGYPRPLLVLGVVEWGVSALAVLLLGVSMTAASPLLVVAILLYGPWAWANAWWIGHRTRPPIAPVTTKR